MNTHKLARQTPRGRLAMVRRLEVGERLTDVAEALGLSTTTPLCQYEMRHDPVGV